MTYDKNTTTLSDDTVLNFYYDSEGQPVAFQVDGETRYYYIKNLQGDVEKIIDMRGNVIASYIYDAWGNVLNQTDNSANGIATLNPLRYRSYVYDQESGFYYLQSRYYDPQTGRFLNVDDTNILLAINNINNKFKECYPTLLSINLFSYCENNPVMLSDHTGYITPANVVGAIICGVIGAVGGYLLSRCLADYLKLSGWKRNLFIVGITGVITASATVIGYFIGPYVAKAGKLFIASVKNLIKRYGFKSLGSTGRTVAKNLYEKLAMEQVKSNPLKWGKQITRIVLNDKRWPSSAGWIKMQAVIKTSKGNITIHFLYNTVLNVFDDFKFV